MGTIRSLTPDDLENALLGACIMGAGGGGPITIGKQLKEHLLKVDRPIYLAHPNDVPDNERMAVSAVIGSPDAAKAALQKRIDFLMKDDDGYAGITMMAQIVLTVKETFAFQINGPAEVIDPNRVLGVVGPAPYWPIEFWMGGYDCDTMVGFMRGQLSLPVYPLRDPGG